MPAWTLTEEQPVTEAPTLTAEQELAAERAMRGLLEESYADLEALYRDDLGWQRIGMERTRFTLEGRKIIAELADLFASGNALIKRGVNLRIAYVWGRGVTVSILDDGAEGQDVNAVWQAFWDDKSNRRALTSSEAHVRYERKLATGGEAFFAFPTTPLTGRVRVRRVPAKEIADRITNPEDAEDVWFYKRTWTAVTLDRTTGKRGSEQRTTYYPAIGYWPASRPKSIDSDPVRWDAPMRHVAVNCPDEDWRGQGDVLAALPWAKLDKEFLEDLAVYMRALTRILGQVTTKSSPAAAAARKALAGPPPPPQGSLPAPQSTNSAAGGWAVTDPNTTMQLMSKSGAQIDSDSSKPFATRAASALEVPLTMLLGDPGITGARATAETLDQPTELMARLRREVHAEFFRDVADYVIEQAVIAPAGPLKGAIARDGDRLLVQLPEGDVRTVSVEWPDFDSTPLKDRIAAIAEADATEKLPEVAILRLLAVAFGLDDIDELIEEMTDADGNWIPRSSAAGQAAVDHFRGGGDPAGLLA